MNKLNNKGYMLIEIILASVITFAIAFSLMNLIISFKNKNEDLYNETSILSDKISITKNIMDDLKNHKIVKIETDNTSTKKIIDLKVVLKNDDIIKNKRIEIENNKITYGDYDTTENKIITGNKSYYKKEILNSTQVGEAIITKDEDEKAITISIPISSIYSSKKYDIKLVFEVNNLLTYEDNLFVANEINNETSGVTSCDVTVEYDNKNQYITLNGTQKIKSCSLGRLTNLTLNEGDEYKIELRYISGSYKTELNNLFVLDFQTNEEKNYSERTINIHYKSLNFPTETNKKTEAKIKYTLNDAKGIYFWYWQKEPNTTTFNKYKIQVLISKVHSKFVNKNEKYGGLDTPIKGDNFKFNGWYDKLSGGNKITEESIVEDNSNKKIYAHWAKTT